MPIAVRNLDFLLRFRTPIGMFSLFCRIFAINMQYRLRFAHQNMKTRKVTVMKKIFVAFAMALLMCSCSTSQTSLDSLRRVVNDASQNGADYSLTEWKKSSEKYCKADKKVFKYALKNSYSSSELKEIATLNADYIAACSSSAAANSINVASTAKDIYSGIADRLKSSKDSYKNLLKTLGNILGIGE